MDSVTVAIDEDQGMVVLVIASAEGQEVRQPLFQGQARALAQALTRAADRLRGSPGG